MGLRRSNQRSRKYGDTSSIVNNLYTRKVLKCCIYVSFFFFFQKKLVSLQEATAAINTTVMSLQGECVKMSEQASILASVQQLKEKVCIRDKILY